MTTKAQPSTISLKTLGGVFEQPKMNHRRDFLRENKLSLRDLQKTTNQKFIQQKQEYENRQYKHLRKFHKTQELCTGPRSASQSRNADYNNKRQSKTTGESAVGDSSGGHVTSKGKQNYFVSRRSYSQQRYQRENSQSMCTCCCSQQRQENKYNEKQYHKHIPRSTSSVSVLSKAESCDKEIQTEDIQDEDFLYEALKKCSSSDVHLLQKQNPIKQSNSRENFSKNDLNCNLEKCEQEVSSTHFRERAPYVYQEHCEDNKLQCDQFLQETSRPQITCILNEHNHAQEDYIANGTKQDLDEQFRSLKITDMRKDADPQLSDRSRQTMCSTSTKRSIHKLGSREDVHLPLYLQKEKREKEEERIRELNKDLNCPLDHYALSEEERLNALNKAKEKMASLINELNHMPMTVETLRLRNRKVEIEKELTQIEFDIRLYSKPKVYIPNSTLQY